MVQATGLNGYTDFSPLSNGAAFRQQQYQFQHEERQPQAPPRTEPSAARLDERGEVHHHNPLMDGVAQGASQPQPEPPPKQPSPTVQPARKPPVSLGVTGLLRREQQKATATDRCALLIDSSTWTVYALLIDSSTWTVSH